MATGYQYRELNHFLDLPLGESFTTTAQLALSGMADNSSEAYSQLHFLGESEHPEYRKYSAVHEHIKRLKVRFNDQIRKEVLVIEEFKVYVNKQNTHLFATTNEKVCDEFFKRLGNHIPEVKTAKRQVNLAELRQRLQMNVRGGWFRELDIVDVAAAAIFGARVSESSDWDRYETSGRLSALIIEFTHQRERSSIQVSANGGIVLYEDLSELDSLEMVCSVALLLAPFSSVPSRDW